MSYRPNDALSVYQASVIKGVDVSTIRRACADGRLRCERLGQRAWLIRWRDLEPWTPSDRGIRAQKKKAE